MYDGATKGQTAWNLATIPVASLHQSAGQFLLKRGESRASVFFLTGVVTHSQFVDPIGEAKNLQLCFKPAKHFFEMATSKACKAFRMEKAAINSFRYGISCNTAWKPSKLENDFPIRRPVPCKLLESYSCSSTNSTYKSSLMTEGMLLHLVPSPRFQH